MAGLGVYVGNEAVSVENFENWLGTSVDFLAAHTGQANWSDWNTSISWLAGQFKDVPATLTWSIPMIANGSSLEAGARGDYNSNYLAAAKTLASTYSDQDKIYVRFGEEFNGTWMAWAAAGKEAEFIATFRNIVDSFRSVSDKFVIEWNVNVGDYGMNPADAYPGDEYVDIIGMDFYYDVAWDSKDPIEAWNYMVSRSYGLQWFEDFAKAHGKPTAYSEWGVNSDTAGPYIQKAQEWFESHNVVYQQYWDSNAAFSGLLNGGNYPNAAAAFQDMFGANAPAPVPVEDFYSVVNGIHTLSDGVEDLSFKGTTVVAISGNDLGNMLTGNAQDNVIDGKAGADRMIGALGDDIYYVDNAGDMAIEGLDAGNDTVRASVNYALGINVENLELLAGALRGTGNALANTITGNASDNVIDGRAGADRMIGGLGNDIYYVDNLGDVTVEGLDAGKDTVRASVNYVIGANIENLELMTGVLRGTGNALANTITGNASDNVIDGRGGADKMVGGLGNDIYYVDHTGDVVVEGLNAGSDWVRASTSYVLGANIEKLELLAGAVNGTGNDLANVITGNAADNVIDGKAGGDKMVGDLGDDIYYVDNVADVVVENSGEGIDTVRTSSSYVLGSHIENLELLSGAVNGTGNAWANTITGNAAANTLYGLSGNDVLMGGAGADTLIGGFGADILTGGDGADTFLFVSLGESVRDRPDLITDLANVDFIDLRQIDASTKVTGDQAFHLVTGFTGGAAEALLQYDAGQDRTVLSLDTNGDKVADSILHIAGNHMDFGNWLW